MDVSKTPDFASLFPEHTFQRRAFLVTSIGAGFALAVQPVSAQTITTDTGGLVAGEVKVRVKDGQMPAYRALPAGGPFTTVLVVHEAWGVHEHIQDIAGDWPRLGISRSLRSSSRAMATFRKWKPRRSCKTCLARSSRRRSTATSMPASRSHRPRGRRTPRSFAITGFCWGGRVVWQYAGYNRKLRTGVSWYGHLSAKLGPDAQNALELAPELTVPVLGLYGGKDQGIPNDQVEKMRAALKEVGNPSQIVVYPDAGHAFLADYRPSYDKAAAEDGWKHARLVQVLRRRLASFAGRWWRTRRTTSRLATTARLRSRDAAEQVELVVGAHRDEIRHAVGGRVERGDTADVPDVLVGKAVRAQRFEIRVDQLGRAQRDLEREFEHRLLPLRNLGLTIIHRDLVGDVRILCMDGQDRSVRDDAVEAVVGARSGDDDHLALGLRQPRIPEHERVMIGKECAKLVRPMREREKHIRNESRLLLHFEHLRADVLGQVRKRRDGIAADGTRVHDGQGFGGT